MRKLNILTYSGTDRGWRGDVGLIVEVEFDSWDFRWRIRSHHSIVSGGWLKEGHHTYPTLLLQEYIE